MFARTQARQRHAAIQRPALILIIGIATLAALSMLVNVLLYFAYVQQGRKLNQLESREAQRQEQAQEEVRQLLGEIKTMQSDPGQENAKAILRKAFERLSQEAEKENR